MGCPHSEIHLSLYYSGSRKKYSGFFMHSLSVIVMDDKGKVDKARSRSILNGQFVYLYEDKGSKGSQVKCIRCEQIYRYHHSTSLLKYHLMNKHAMSNASISMTSSSTSRQSTVDDQGCYSREVFKAYSSYSRMDE